MWLVGSKPDIGLIVVQELMLTWAEPWNMYGPEATRSRP